MPGFTAHLSVQYHLSFQFGAQYFLIRVTVISLVKLVIYKRKYRKEIQGLDYDKCY